MALKRETVVLEPERAEDQQPRSGRVWLLLGAIVAAVLAWMVLSSGSSARNASEVTEEDRELQTDPESAERVLSELERQRAAKQEEAPPPQAVRTSGREHGEFSDVAEGLPPLPVTDPSAEVPLRDPSSSPITANTATEKSEREQAAQQVAQEWEREAFDDLKEALRAPMRGSSATGFAKAGTAATAGVGSELGDLDGAVSPAAMGLLQQSLATLGGQGGQGGADVAGVLAALGGLGGDDGRSDTQAAKARKLEFFQRGGEQLEGGSLPTGTRRLGPYTVAMGAFFHASLETPINSNLPGMIRGRITQNVYDSATGSHLLIPSGTEVVGTSSGDVSHGQERLQAAWVRLNFPNGEVKDIGSMPGGGADGLSGLDGKVNRHFGRILGTALLLAVPMVTYELTAPVQVASLEGAVHRGVGNALLQTGSKLADRAMDLPPTIEIPKGKRFVIHVTKDVPFDRPYEDGHSWRPQ